MSRFSFVCTLSVACVFATGSISTQAAPVNDPNGARVAGNVPPGLAAARLDGHLDVGRQITVVMALDLRDHAGANALIAAQQDPTSPLYHQWISPQEFQIRFGPLPSDLQAVREFLTAQGFVNVDQPVSTMITADGTTDMAERAFNVVINNYTYQDRSVYSNDRDPTVPAALAGKVIHVGGLDNLTVMRAMHEPPIRYRAPDAVDGGEDQMDPQYRNGTNFYFLPRDTQMAHGEKTAYFDAGKKGISGAELAVASSGDVQLADVTDQDTRCGGVAAGYNAITAAASGPHTMSSTCVPGTGAGTGCTFTNSTSNGSFETNWDASLASCIANDNHIGIYLSQTTAITSFGVMYQYLADRASTIKVVTHSWGLCLTNMNVSVLNSDENALAQAAAGGQAWFISSGDNGSDSCGNGTTSALYPACSQYVTAAGGTSMDTSAAGSFAANGFLAGYPANGEQGCSNSGGGQATTGGTVPRPAWQTGTGVPAGTKRVFPDISMHYGNCSSPSNGLYYFVRFGGSFYLVVGTSGDAPQLAAYWAVANQVTGTNLGHAAPLLFRILRNEAGTSYANDFHDTLTGSNGAYSCNAGFDMVTGLGSPKFDSLYPELSLLLCTGPVMNPIANASAACGSSYTSGAPSLATGTTPVTWSLAPAVPAGMTINPSSGVVSWPTTVSGTFPYSITTIATNSCGSDSKTWSLTVKRGDFTGDGVVDLNDVAAFVNDLLLDPPFQTCPGEMNLDALINGDDVGPFVRAMGL